MPSILLRNIPWIYTCDDSDRLVEQGWIQVEGNRIAAMGREPCPVPGADQVIDLAGCIVVPGLINIHHHFFQSLTRAIPLGQRATAIEWLYASYPIWAEIDAEAMYWGCLTTAAEQLLSGATTSADHSYYLPFRDDRMIAAQLRAVGEAGLRLHLVRGCMPTIEGDLDTRLQTVMGDRVRLMLDDDEDLLARAERDLQRHHDAGDGAMVRLALGPTGVTYAKPQYMRAFADLAERYGCGLHTHYLPRDSERERAQRLLGMTPLQFLREAGWIRPGSWFAHCPELNDEEIDAFADAGCGVAHCPRTVIRLGYPMTRITAMRQRGVQVGIGVDGSASNDGGSMLSDVRLALLLHRVNSGLTADPSRDWLTPYDALLMATRAGAAVLGRRDIGHLAPGMMADITAFDLRRAAYAGGLADPLGGLLMAGSDSNAALTMVHGRVRVRDGRLVDHDEARIVEHTNRAAARMLETAEANTGIRFRDYPGAARRPTPQAMA